VQFIGPGSSLSFHIKLRTLVGRGALREFVLSVPAVYQLYLRRILTLRANI
jgi:hypothetical protein